MSHFHAALCQRILGLVASDLDHLTSIVYTCRPQIAESTTVIALIEPGATVHKIIQHAYTSPVLAQRIVQAQTAVQRKHIRALEDEVLTDIELLRAERDRAQQRLARFTPEVRSASRGAEVQQNISQLNDLIRQAQTDLEKLEEAETLLDSIDEQARVLAVSAVPNELLADAERTADAALARTSERQSEIFTLSAQAVQVAGILQQFEARSRLLYVPITQD